MTFEEYAQENLVKHGFTEVDMTLIRMGWNAAKADGADIGGGTMQADGAHVGEAVEIGEIEHDYNRVVIKWHRPPKYGQFKTANKVYVGRPTCPSASVPEVATEAMLTEGVEALNRGMKKFPDNYTQVVSNIWEDMAAAANPPEQESE